MKQIALLLILFLLLLNNMFAQNIDWAKNLLGTDYDEASCICTDKLGNIYITGGFQGYIDFDPSSSTFALTSTYSNDVFIAKYDSNANFIWAKNIYGTNNDVSKYIQTDINGDIYLAGSYSGTLDLNPDTLIENTISTYYEEIFFAKYDSNGNYKWGHSIGNSAGVTIKGMLLDSSLNLYFTGDFLGTIDFNAGAEVNELTSTPSFTGSSKDVYLVKYDTDGNFLWVKSYGDITQDNTQSFFLRNNMIFITGNSFLSGYNLSYMFLLKYDVDSTPLDSITFNNGSIQPKDIYIDTEFNIYAVGTFKNTIDFNPSSDVYNLISSGENDIFIVKYNVNYNLVWAKQIEINSDFNVINIDLLSNNKLYITGYYTDSLLFSQYVNVKATGLRDYYIFNLDTSGNFNSFNSINGISSWVNVNCFLYSNNAIYITGGFGGTIDFDISNGNFPLTYIGNTDIFFAKYDEFNTSINIDEQNKSITLFPNPCNYNLNISISEGSLIDYDLKIYNILGEVEWKSRMVFNKNNTVQIITQELSSGIHFLKISNEKSQYIKSFVKYE